MITQNDLLEALRSAQTPDGIRPEGAITVSELREATGHCDKYIRDWIRPMLKDGSAEMVTVRHTRMDGRPTRVSAYRFKDS